MSRLEKGKLPFGLSILLHPGPGATGICLAYGMQYHFRMLFECRLMCQSKSARENLCRMGLGGSLFYSSMCWAGTPWIMLFEVLMLKDIVAWVILLSLFFFGFG